MNEPVYVNGRAVGRFGSGVVALDAFLALAPIPLPKETCGVLAANPWVMSDLPRTRQPHSKGQASIESFRNAFASAGVTIGEVPR